MAKTNRNNGKVYMNFSFQKIIPEEIIKNSLFLNVTSAAWSLVTAFEKGTQTSQNRFLILIVFRGGVILNQNQIANLLGLDRTVVHRIVKSLILEKLLSETKAETGKSFLLRLTQKGELFRERLIAERKAIDQKLGKLLNPKETLILTRALKKIANFDQKHEKGVADEDADDRDTNR